MTTKEWLKELHAFDRECREAQYTDTQTAWKLLKKAKALIKKLDV